MLFSVLCLLCLCERLFICALWSPAGKELTSWLSSVVSNCEFVTFPLVSWVRCGNPDLCTLTYSENSAERRPRSESNQYNHNLLLYSDKHFVLLLDLATIGIGFEQEKGVWNFSRGQKYFNFELVLQPCRTSDSQFLLILPMHALVLYKRMQ